METNIQTKYTNLINELYRSFDFFNGYFCESKLQRPIITIQGEKKKGKTYGWFGKEFWIEYGNEVEGNKVNELNLTAEALYRDPNEVLGTLLHEMAHLKNAQDNIPDCNAAQYHNGNFKKVAEFFGLEVSRMKGKGWAVTNLGTKAKEVIDLLAPKIELYKIVRNPPQRFTPEPKVINLNVDISYEEKISYLTSKYGKKREMTEAAIDHLYNLEKDGELLYGSKSDQIDVTEEQLLEENI